MELSFLYKLLVVSALVLSGGGNSSYINIISPSLPFNLFPNTIIHNNIFKSVRNIDGTLSYYHNISSVRVDNNLILNIYLLLTLSVSKRYNKLK